MRFPLVPITNVGHSGSSAIVFEDSQVSISNVRIPAANAPTWRDFAHGIGGGVTFPILGFGIGDLIYFDVQTAHAMKLLSILDEHIHFCTPTDGTGDKFKFQLDAIAAGIDGNFAALSGSPFTPEHTITADYSNLHKLFDLANFPAVNTTVSSWYRCKLTRIASSVDEYAGEVYIGFIDGHFKKDTSGSLKEDSKV